VSRRGKQLGTGRASRQDIRHSGESRNSFPPHGFRRLTEQNDIRERLANSIARCPSQFREPGRKIAQWVLAVFASPGKKNGRH